MKNNKVAWINGGARIGIDVAKFLATHQFDVVISYRSSIKEAKKASQLVENQNQSSLIVQADLSRYSDATKVIRKIKHRFGRLDVLVNMASVYSSNSSTDFLKDFDKNINANLKTAANSCQASYDLLKKNKGKIINFCDWVVASGRPRYRNFVSYYTSKASLLGLTEALALQWAPHILVNAIAPGPIMPPANQSKSDIKEVENFTPLKKWGGAGEISKAVSFLVNTDFVTGECIRIDGGRHLI